MNGVPGARALPDSLALAMVTAGPEPIAGIARYCEGIIAGLHDAGFSGRLHLFVTEGATMPSIALHPSQVKVHRYRPRLGRSPVICLLWHLLVLPFKAWHHGAEVLWVCNHKPVSGFGLMPVVITVHDVAELLIKGKYDWSRTLYRRALFYPLARRAARIATVSESAREQIARLLSVPMERLMITSNTVDTERFRPVPTALARDRLSAELGLQADYILFVGRIEHPSKNLLRLIDAYRSADRQGVELVLAGAPSWRADIVFEAVADAAQYCPVRYIGVVDESILPTLYSGAIAVVLPSLNEGFGLTALEAMACGTPIVAAAAGALPEVVGDAGRLFAAEDTAALTAELNEMINDSSARTTYAERGLHRAAEFGSTRVASQITQLLGVL